MRKPGSWGPTRVNRCIRSQPAATKPTGPQRATRARHDAGLADGKGRPGSRDIDKAAERLRQSADHGHADGRVTCGALPARGRGHGEAARYVKTLCAAKGWARTGPSGPARH